MLSQFRPDGYRFSKSRISHIAPRALEAAHSRILNRWRDLCLAHNLLQLSVRKLAFIFQFHHDHLFPLSYRLTHAIPYMSCDDL